MTSRRNFIQGSLALGAAAGTGISPLFAMEETISKASKPLKILFLGGTGFLGPHTVQYAIDRGHEVTLFNRGRSKEVLFPELEKLVGNRDPEIDQGLEPLKGRQWDCVIDTSAYVPRIADASAGLLAEQCEQYLFVSTISVYAGFTEVGMKETAAVGTLEDTTVEVVDGATYGPLKAYCEQAVQKHFGERATVVRPGLIVGPRDRTDRYTYWPVRMAKGGQVLGPGDGTDKLQYIDVRDLGMFMVHCLENKTTGVFNTISDAATETAADMLASCAEASQVESETVWVPTDFLTEKGVQPWSDLPVWVPNQGAMAGLSQVDVSAAMAAGLTIRPRVDTARDTLSWFQTLEAERQQTLRAGMKFEQEQEVIKAWLATQPAQANPMTEEASTSES